VLLGLGWLFLSNRPQLNDSSVKGSSVPAADQPPLTPPSTLEPPPKEKEVTPLPTEPISGAWGNSNEYKFGRLPGGRYPKSCAFTQTDINGRATIDKSQLEYWACSDEGGDSESGYKVVWVDGKETTYTFQPGGGGIVVGTNGNTYPIKWRNDSHEGDPIIVIDHQDGSVSWIPGNISPASAPGPDSSSSGATGAPPVDRPAP
jgi:hypothetical protein